MNQYFLKVSLLVPPKVNDNNDLLKMYNKMKKDKGFEYANEYIDQNYFYSLSEDIVLSGKFKRIYGMAEEKDLGEKRTKTVKKKHSSVKP